MADESKSLKDRVALLILLRLLMALVLLGAVLLFDLERGGAFLGIQSRELVYSAISGLLFLCMVSALIHERRSDRFTLDLVVLAMLVADGLFASVLVLVTGGTDSIFTFFYSLAIINAALVLYRRGALFSATVSGACFVVIGVGQAGLLGEDLAQLMHSGNLLGDSPLVTRSLQSVLPNLVTNVLAFYAVAFLAAVLAEKLKAADELARMHKEGLEKLTNIHETILSSLENGLLTVDSSERIVYANDVVCDLLDLPAEEVRNRHLERFFPNLKGVLGHPELDQTRHVETVHEHPTQGTRYLRWSISVMRTSSGAPVGHILLFFDNTRVRDMEIRVQRAERLAAMGRLAANIAHEIRNPLASLSGSIQLLADTLEVQGPERRLMDIVVRETDHLNSWISEFLDYTRPKKMEQLPIDLSEIVDETVEILRNDRHLEQVEIQFERGGKAVILGDRRRLKQIVYNLVLNAAQAAGNNGVIRLKVARIASGVEFTVWDNGPGIAEEHISRIFEPFFTTKPGGTGLGLATVYRNVEDHDGSIHVESSPGGEGTTFSIYFPAVRSAVGEFEQEGPERLGGT